MLLGVGSEPRSLVSQMPALTETPSHPAISIMVKGSCHLISWICIHLSYWTSEHTYSWVVLTFTLPNVCIIFLFSTQLSAAALPDRMYPLGQENTFWKKENVTLQPSAAKEPWYFHLVKQHISFWKENCVISFLCTDLCASHSKVQMTVWFITVMMIMKNDLGVEMFGQFIL